MSQEMNYSHPQNQKIEGKCGNSALEINISLTQLEARKNVKSSKF
jgi:hypothetical protein